MKTKLIIAILLALLVLSILLIIFINKPKYKNLCLLCNNEIHKDTNYIGLNISAKENIVTYFKQETSYINREPLINLFVTSTNPASYTSEKITLCSNNLKADNEVCYKEIKNKNWENNPHEKTAQEEYAYVSTYFDRNENIIYGAKLKDSVFGDNIKSVIGTINLKTLEDKIIAENDNKAFQELVKYQQYSNNNKRLFSNINTRGFVFLLDMKDKTSTVYITGPQNTNITPPSYMDYKFLVSEMGLNQ